MSDKDKDNNETNKTIKKEIEIIRTFHPVGQGAFYSERHPSFNVVYDCGNLTYNPPKGRHKNSGLNKKLNGVVNGAFKDIDTIDVLFLSHLHYDHYSLIPTLKERVKEIKHVVMPYLDDILKAFYLSLLDDKQFKDYGNLIIDPKLFFKDQTIIIFVKDVGEDSNIELDTAPEQDIHNIANLSEIDSGTKLYVAKYEDSMYWIFIPYSFNHKQLRNDFEIFLNKTQLYGKTLKNLVDELIKTSGLASLFDVSNAALLKELKKFHKNELNENSMIVYSGPIKSVTNYNQYHAEMSVYGRETLSGIIYTPNYLIPEARVGCVYTGDVDANKLHINQTMNSLSAIYKSVWENVGTIQIPHHGSINNFNAANLFGGINNQSLDDENIQYTPYYCPLSVGTENPYGHPADRVIEDIISHDCSPFLVTEKQDSVFIERIVYYIRREGDDPTAKKEDDVESVDEKTEE